jgi:hypothetical protein
VKQVEHRYILREGRNPNENRPLDYEDLENPYIKKEGETYEEKMRRLNRVKKMLQANVDEAVGVKDKRILDGFSAGKGGSG